MKKIVARVLCLALVLSLSGCGMSAQNSDAPDANYKEGYTAGYEAGYHDGKQQAAGNEKRFAQFSGSFTATVEQLLPDYYALPGKTIAVVHFFQDRPFLLHFQKDLTGELLEGTSYVFEFEPFEVELSEDEENPDISDHMYSINVTGYELQKMMNSDQIARCRQLRSYQGEPPNCFIRKRRAANCDRVQAPYEKHIFKE